MQLTSLVIKKTNVGYKSTSLYKVLQVELEGAINLSPIKLMSLFIMGLCKGQKVNFERLAFAFYLPLFKLCPELKFSFGLVDIVNKDRSDLTDKDMEKYTQALSSGKTRMISLVFNFE